MLSSPGSTAEAARNREIEITPNLPKPVRESDPYNAVVRVVGRSAGDRTRETDAEETLSEGKAHYLVLIAEDNLVNQKLALRLLEKQGHSVVIANNGREAVTAYQAQQFDLVMMDVQMPELNGYEATAAIREIEKVSGKHIPILAMTAHAMKGDRERCLDAGMDGYVSKPINTKELFAVIDELTAKYKNSAEAGTVAQVFDANAALHQIGGEMDFLVQLLGLFFDEYPAQLKEIQQAVDRGDCETVANVTHKIAGSVGNFGAPMVLAAAQNLEQLARGNRPSALAQACAELSAALEQLSTAVSPLLKVEVPGVAA